MANKKVFFDNRQDRFVQFGKLADKYPLLGADVWADETKEVIAALRTNHDVCSVLFFHPNGFKTFAAETWIKSNPMEKGGFVAHVYEKTKAYFCSFDTLDEAMSYAYGFYLIGELA